MSGAKIISKTSLLYRTDVLLYRSAKRRLKQYYIFVEDKQHDYH